MFTYESRVRFSECDENGKLRFCDIVDYLQDASTIESELKGIGVKFLKAKGMAWVINAWQIDVLSYPVLNEKIEIGTMPYEFKGSIGNRNFFIKDEKGEYIVKANSVWILIELDTGKPIRPTEEYKKLYPIEEKLDMEYMKRKVDIPKEMETLTNVKIKRHRLDTNAHVNNGQYVRIAVESLNKSGYVKRFRTEYRNQAHLDDTLLVRYSVSEEKDYISLNKENGDVCCVMEFTY